MSRSKRVMRRRILQSLFDHLELNYGLEHIRESLINGQFTDREIDAVLAFKSDSRLDELRGALARLENGTYGICIGCKKMITQQSLDIDLTRRLCSDCERQFSHRLVAVHASHSSV